MDSFFAFFILVVIGMIFAIPILLPPIRRRAKANPRTRISVIAFFSLSVWIISFIVSGYMGGKITSIFQTITGNPTPVVLDLMDEFGLEIGFRYMMPPPLRNNCFTSIPEICQAADIFLAQEITWLGYLGRWLIMSITGITTGVIGWLLTRNTEKTKRKNDA